MPPTRSENEWKAPSGACQVITAVVSKKGGVGKTTTSVNLSAALAAAGQRVLVIDLDSQASTSLSFGVSREELAPSSADLLLSSIPATQVIRKTRITDLDLITASSDLMSLDNDLGPLPHKEARLRSALQPLSRTYDHILLDCPSSLSLAPLNALVAADAFMVPTVPHYLALEGVRNLFAAVNRLYQRFGTRTFFLGLLLTMVDYRTNVNRDNVTRIRGLYGSHVFAVEIRTNIRLAEAPEAGQTIFEYDSTCTGAKAYQLLAEEFMMRAGDLPPAETLAGRVV